MRDQNWHNQQQKIKRLEQQLAESKENMSKLRQNVCTLEREEQSVQQLGASLAVVGEGGFFKGYGWKLKEVRKELLRRQHEFDIVLFTDSFVRLLARRHFLCCA